MSEFKQYLRESLRLVEQSGDNQYPPGYDPAQGEPTGENDGIRFPNGDVIYPIGPGQWFIQPSGGDPFTYPSEPIIPPVPGGIDNDPDSPRYGMPNENAPFYDHWWTYPGGDIDAMDPDRDGTPDYYLQPGGGGLRFNFDTPFWKGTPYEGYESGSVSPPANMG